MELQTDRAEELAAQYLAGDRQVMEDLIQEIQDKVYYHCVKTLRNENDAQDAAQEVLVAVLQGLNELKNPAAFHFWLNRIIARTCMKTCAREHREIAVGESAEEPFFEDLDDQKVPEKIIDTQETRRMIRELVDGLPAAQRLCVLMYYYDELPVKDIAEAIGTPENTVKSRLSYARKTIKAGVDRWIAQGLTLCAFTPLPYLRYFLQKESEDCRLPPVVVLRIREALLAAGLIGAAAAGGGTMAGVTAGGTVTAALAHKGLVTLAGLLLAGGVGGLLLQPAQQPDSFREPDPPRVVETLPAPAEPEALEYHPVVSLEEEPAPDREEQAIYVPVPLPAKEPPEGSGGGFAPAPPPEETPGPETQPDSTPDPEPAAKPNTRPSQETAPTRNPSANSGSGSGTGTDSGSNPYPAAPDPITSTLASYRINYNFGNYLGENEKGVHEFDVYIPANREMWSYPFEDGHYYIREEISDEVRVGEYAGHIYGKAPGTCEVRYYVSENPDGPFKLKAVAHVTVKPEEPVTPDYDWGNYERTLGSTAYFRRTLVIGDYEDQTPFRPGQFQVKAESGSPNIVGVTGAELRAVGAGSVTVQYYTRWTESDPWVRAAVVYVTVLEEAPPKAEVIERQTLRLGYGCNGTFFDIWQGELPRNLHFTSSKSSVVYIQPTGGGFSTLSPGTAELAAYEPHKPNLLYVLEVQVDDAFQWEYAVEDMVLTVGETQEQEIEYTVPLADEVHLGVFSINSADSNIAAVKIRLNDLPEDMIRFEITGRSQGTAEIVCKVPFDVLTYDGIKGMETAFSFQVQVNEPPEDGIPTVRRELEGFGNCSGYGYTGRFPSVWGGELPADLTYASSDPAVACISGAGGFTTLSAGTVVLTATRTAEPACRYALTLHVKDRFDCIRTVKEAIANPEYSNSTQGPKYELFSSGRLTDIQWTSSDPEILTVIAGTAGGCSFKAHRVGKAALNGVATFMIYTTEGTRYLKDTFSMPVTVEYYRETEAVEPEQFGFCSGCGYTGSLRDYFPDLPDGLYFGSSDESIASIHNDGSFTTLKPGRVLLTAYTEFAPSGHQYAVWLNVQDAMDWTCSLEELALDVGGSDLCGVTDVQLHSGVKLSSAYWFAADTRIISVTKDADDPLLCRVEAKQSGTTEVTGRLTIRVPYYFWGRVSSADLSVTVSFPVTVREPAEVDFDTLLEVP